MVLRQIEKCVPLYFMEIFIYGDWLGRVGIDMTTLHCKGHYTELGISSIILLCTVHSTVQYIQKIWPATWVNFKLLRMA